MTLVKSLYSGDPDVIRKHADLQGMKPRALKRYEAWGLHPVESMYTHALGEPCGGRPDAPSRSPE
jgi:hypothetical protein